MEVHQWEAMVYITVWYYIHLDVFRTWKHYADDKFLFGVNLDVCLLGLQFSRSVLAITRRNCYICLMPGHTGFGTW